MRNTRILILALLGAGLAQAAEPPAAMLDGYRAERAGPFDAARGEQMWNEVHPHNGENRSCTSCHTSNLGQPGRHAATNKPIEPMAPSINPQRLTDPAKIEKWFTRNCKWTFGRACSAQEKGDFLTFIASQ